MPTSHPPKVLLIGWDAADWKVIHPLIDQGKMPHLARFLEDGVSGNLATLQPVLSPMLWSSIATGKRPYKHGIHGFSEPDPITKRIRPVTNLSRKTKALWNILNQEGKNTITVGWWPSNPAEPLSRGVMVSDHFQNAPRPLGKTWPLPPGTIHPKRLIPHLQDLRFHPGELNEEDLRPFLNLQDLTRQQLDELEKSPRVQSLMKIIADATSIHAATTALIQNEPWDFLAVYYDAIDHFGHAFMKFHPPQRPHIDDHDFRIFHPCVEGGYRFHDLMLGTLLDLAGDDTTVILMSDHGFHPDDLRPAAIPREPAGPAAEHRQFGIFAAKGPGFKKDALLHGANLLDIAPTILHRFGLPVGEDMDGKVLLDIYDPEKDPPAPVERIPSWDHVAGDHGMHPPDQQISPAESEAALDQLVALGYIDAPDADLDKALRQTTRELNYNLAQSYLDGGIYNEAVALLETLHSDWPMEHRFGFQLARAYQAQNRPTDLRRLVQAISERRLQEAKEAQAELQALHDRPAEEQQAEQKKIASLSNKEKEKFQRQRRDLLGKAQPNLYTLHYLEATADFAEKQYPQALAKLTELESHHGARKNGLLLRAQTLTRLHRWDEARQTYQEVLTLDPETAPAHYGLARISLHKRDFTAAIQSVRTSLGLVFYHPKAHYLHGLALLRSGQWQAADDAFQTCLRQAPLFTAAHRQLLTIARHYHRNPSLSLHYEEQLQQSRQQLRDLRESRLSSTPSHDSQASDPHPTHLSFPQRPDALHNVPKTDLITLVSGLPRSGTSLMMQILAAAGLIPYTDDLRPPDESNQRGYLEHQKVTSLAKASPTEKQWLAQAKGHALKVVAPLLPHLPLQDPTTQTPHHYRVLFMERPPREIAASQATMLQRLGKEASKADPTRAYQQQVHAAQRWINTHQLPALAIDYPTLVHTPERLLPQIADFLGCPEHLPAMRAAIDPTLHRERSEPTTNT